MHVSPVNPDYTNAPPREREAHVHRVIAAVADATISHQTGLTALRAAGLTDRSDWLRVAVHCRGVPSEAGGFANLVSLLAQVRTEPSTDVEAYHAQVQAAQRERRALAESGNALIAMVALLALTGLVLTVVAAAWAWLPAGSGVFAILAIGALASWLWLRLSEANDRVQADVDTLRAKAGAR